MQTKGGMKKGENAGESESWGGRKIWGEKKIVSLSRSLNTPPPLSKWLPLTHSTIILWDNGKQGKERGVSGEEKEMDRWGAGGKEEERTSIIRQAFPSRDLQRQPEQGVNNWLNYKITLQGPYTTTHRGPCSSRAACWFFFFSPLFSLPINVCPSSGAPGRRRSSSPRLDFNLFSHWMIPPSLFSVKSRRERGSEGVKRQKKGEELSLCQAL